MVHRIVTERKIYINITTEIKLSKTKELPIKSDSQSFTVLSPMLSNGWNPFSFGIERWVEPYCTINSSKVELNFRLSLDLISNRKHVVTIDIGYFLTFPSLWHVCSGVINIKLLIYNGWFPGKWWKTTIFSWVRCGNSLVTWFWLKNYCHAQPSSFP